MATCKGCGAESSKPANWTNWECKRCFGDLFQTQMGKGSSRMIDEVADLMVSENIDGQGDGVVGAGRIWP